MFFRMKTLARTLTVLTIAVLVTIPTQVLPLLADREEGSGVTLQDRIAASKKDGSSSPKLEWALRRVVVGLEAAPAAGMPALGEDVTGDGVRVIIEHSNATATEIESLVTSAGGYIELAGDSRTQCILPAQSMNTVATHGSVNYVRLPYDPVAEEVTEALSLVNIDEWQTNGYTGFGTKIGVLDVGFYDYASLIGTDLKAPEETWWAPSIGNAGSSPHGTACAEILNDIAPNAQYYFANFDTEVEWDNAVLWLIDRGVDIISCSVGWYVVGPRDGTGDILDVIDTAKSNGIFWTQSAGNYAERHWGGPWQNTDEGEGDYRLDFGGDPPSNCNTIVVESGDTVWVRVWWDDPWESSTNDYDLTVFDPDNDGDVYWESWTVQNPGVPPREWVQFTAPVNGTYYIYVDEYSSTRDPDFELFCSHPLQYGEPAGSISDNAASASACTVGAVAWDNPTTLRSFSARGPTVDERTKPDLVGPDGISTDTYGSEGFEGTSAAAPHVAGAAALVLEGYPSYDEDDIQSLLETNAVDLGAAGADNLYGYGRLLLPEAPATTDFGDAPDPLYPTTLNSNGARHEVVTDFCLGSFVDTEGNALHNATATGDDTIDSSDDEDGVLFTSALIPGNSASITVIASQPGYLDGWIDFTDDGDWDDTGEKLWTSSQSLSSGANYLNFSVPSGAALTTGTFARFRLSSAGSLSPTGEAADGEVEDYIVAIGTFDWGDAPDDGYPVLASDSGARHLVTGPYLGTSVDGELDGQPTATANGDDADGNDDEDGVEFTSDLVAGIEVSLNVTSSGVGLLDAWIDFNGDYDWDDDNEQVFSSEALVAGVNGLTFNIPADAVTVETSTFARFRVSSTGGLSPSGTAETGEVEDYMVTVLPPPKYDFGDAPDPSYPTLLASNGARHIIAENWYLGAGVDDEDDGQPDTHAVGDDSDAGGDDEDGVVFTADYEAGQTMTLVVTASQEGYLDAWVDFNDNGDWGDTGEQIYTSQLLNAGENPLSFPIPSSASMEDSTFSRFRFSDSGGLSYTGHADTGEVEDYELSSVKLYEGDANLDEKTNIVDAMFVAQYTVGIRTLNADQLTCADTTDDGAVNIVDAMHLAQYTVDPTGAAGVLFKPLWEAETDLVTYPPA